MTTAEIETEHYVIEGLDRFDLVPKAEGGE